MDNAPRKPQKRNAPGGGQRRKPTNTPNDRSSNRPGDRPGRPGDRPGNRSDNRNDPRKPRSGGKFSGRSGGPHSARPGARPQGRSPYPQAPRVRSPRETVLTLARRQCQRWPDLALTEPQTAGLAPRDAAFAHALYDQLIRRWLTCRHLVQNHLKAEWPKVAPEPQAALLVGAAQLLFMRTVPPHAAVDESVRWTSDVASKAAAGLVNAVLRKLADDIDPEATAIRAAAPSTRGISEAGVAIRRSNTDDEAPDDQPDAPKTSREPSEVLQEPWTDQLDAIPLEDGSLLRFKRDVLPQDPLERLAVATSCPVELLAEWIKHTPLRDVRRIALHGIVRPPVILNTQTATNVPDSLVPHNAPGHHVHLGTRDELEQLLRDHNDLWVQDPASSLAVQSVIDLEPECVIDMCAGRGTKTRQLAAAFPNARVIATDIDRPRFQTLEEAFADNDRVETIPYDRLIDLAGQADLILLDVPCSNTGVLARRVEARYRADRSRTAELTGMQRQIIADAIPLLKSGTAKPGRILYSTCSLDPRENEAQAAWAAKWHSFEPEREHRREPSATPGDPPETYSDGSYAVLLS